MKYSLLLFGGLLFVSCGNSNKSGNPTEEIIENTVDSLASEILMQEDLSNKKSKKQEVLGEKYQGLVDAGILNITEAQKYSDIETGFRELRIQLQKEGKWDGTELDNIANRNKWLNDKKSQVIELVGADNYKKIQSYLKSLR